MAKAYGCRWQIVGDLGTGGQAHVYRVRDLQKPGDDYALKRLKDDRRVGRLVAELAALQGLTHPNIARLIDHHVSGDPPYYLVTEMLDGGDLAERVADYAGDVVRALDLFRAICSGVGAAHLQEPPIVHRDLKPENVLFRGETPVVTDFGLCWTEGGERLTATEERIGAFRYMAPELEDGRVETPTPACDVYSLGKLLYYIVSGGAEFSREKHRENEWDLRSRFRGWGVGTLQNIQLEYVSQLLDQMIVADPSRRYGNAVAAADAAAIIAKLVKEGHYPFAAHMPCKFCGQGSYHRHGKDDTVLDTKNWSGLEVAMFECSACGHLQLFSYGAFTRDPKRASLR